MAMTNLIQLIDRALHLRNMTAAKASNLAVGNSSLIKNIKLGKKPSFEAIEKLSQVLGLNFHIGLPNQDIIEPAGQVELMGSISAGGGDSPDDGKVSIATEPASDMTSPPPGLSEKDLAKWGGIMALAIRGKSMEPIYRNGDTIYIYHNDPLKYEPERLIGKDCAVILGGDYEGETYLKRLRRSDNGQKGFFNLESINLRWQAMENMPVKYIYPVRYLRHNL